MWQTEKEISQVPPKLAALRRGEERKRDVGDRSWVAFRWWVMDYCVWVFELGFHGWEFGLKVMIGILVVWIEGV